VVIARDALGAIVTAYTGTIHFASSDAAALLPANYAFQGGDAGIHAFSNGITLETAATSVSVTVSDAGGGALSDSQTVTVVAAGLDHFAFAAPATVSTGVTFGSGTITAFDSFGNVAKTFAPDPVTISVNPPDGALSGTG